MLLSTETDDMDMTAAPVGRKRSRADSDASSDWGEWADAMVAQGERPAGEPAATGGAEGGSPTDAYEDDDQWIRTMMEQPSVVLGADNRVWDYVLQMVVEKGEETPGSATVASPAQEVCGVAATEYVSRWLRRNLPLALPCLTFTRLATHSGHQEHLAGAGGDDDRGGRRRLLVGRAVVDSVAEPSAIAVIYRSPEQGMHRINLFSLGANAGAALVAAVVQPGAAGLLLAQAAALRDDPGTEGYNGPSRGEFSSDRPPGAGRSNLGVVFESLDSRILDGALVSAMGRLGLGIKYRSRSGMWRLRPGVMLPTAHPSMPRVGATPLTLEDASFIARCCCLQYGGAPMGEEAVGGAEALVRGLIWRNPSAGIRKGNQLVAWCLSFDNGLAGVLHVSCPRPAQSGGREEEEEGLSPPNVALALLASLLAHPSEAESPLFAGIANIVSRDTPATLGGAGTARSAGDFGTSENQPGLSAPSTQRDSSRFGLAAVVIDDASPLANVFQELGLLERVCDADWVRFEPVANCSSGREPGMLADGEIISDGRGGDGTVVVPLAAMVMHP